jgi:hypothetical protein
MRLSLISAILLPVSFALQEAHNHPPPEKLGTVSFQTSCKPGTQQQFNRAVALLHSFAYSMAEEAFQSVVDRDPRCAIAHWGIAMTHYHQLWDPPSLLQESWLHRRKSRRLQCFRNLLPNASGD